jgi:hypothetical protein
MSTGEGKLISAFSLTSSSAHPARYVLASFVFVSKLSDIFVIISSGTLSSATHLQICVNIRINFK